jgi:hypothetical protein
VIRVDPWLTLDRGLAVELLAVDVVDVRDVRRHCLVLAACSVAEARRCLVRAAKWQRIGGSDHVEARADAVTGALAEACAWLVRAAADRERARTLPASGLRGFTLCSGFTLCNARSGQGELHCPRLATRAHPDPDGATPLCDLHACEECSGPYDPADQTWAWARPARTPDILDALASHEDPFEVVSRLAALEDERGPLPPGGATGGVVARARREARGEKLPSAAIRARDRVRSVFQASESPAPGLPHGFAAFHWSDTLPTRCPFCLQPRPTADEPACCAGWADVRAFPESPPPAPGRPQDARSPSGTTTGCPPAAPARLEPILDVGVTCAGVATASSSAHQAVRASERDESLDLSRPPPGGYGYSPNAMRKLFWRETRALRLLDLDQDAAWDAACAILRENGEDVDDLLRRAATRVDAWRKVADVPPTPSDAVPTPARTEQDARKRRTIHLDPVVRCDVYWRPDPPRCSCWVDESDPACLVHGRPQGRK